MDVMIGEEKISLLRVAPRLMQILRVLACSLSLLQSNALHAQWVQTNGPNGGTIRALAVIDSNLFAGTSGGVYRTTDNGATWNSVNSGLMNADVSSLTVAGMNLFAGTHGGVFGISFAPLSLPTWTEVNNGLTSLVVPSLAASGINLFAGTTGGIFLSTNSGGSWTPVNHGLTNTFVYSLAISSDGAGGSNLFAGTKGGGVFRSTDNGTSWTAVNSGLTNNYVTTLVVEGVNLFAGALNSDVLRSTDSGAGWAKLGLAGLLCGVADDTNLFVGTTHGVFLSTNNGTSWTAVNAGLTDTTVVASIAILGTNLFAGTDQNVVWSRPRSEITTSVHNDLRNLPMKFVLEQNYPNPFNPSTEINFSITTTGRATVEVYNIVGQRVALLFDDVAQTGQYHRVTFSGVNLASGLYLVRLQSGSSVSTKKMLLLK